MDLSCPWTVQNETLQKCRETILLVHFVSDLNYLLLFRSYCKKSESTHGLPPIFLNKTKGSINFPLSIMYRTFIDLHTLPSEWRLSIITPVFKKGSPSDPANYRPIALTCTCCKIMESNIVSDLLDFLSDHNLITRHQHGFLKKHSTSTNLLESLNDWTISLSNHRTVVVAYIDFQKAFDSVSHPKLLHKLSSYGINGNLYYWISAFLSNRRQQVKVGSSSSTTCNVISGVPQGSVIGSLLFNLFINDVTDHLDSTSTSKIFADDIKIYTELINHNSDINFQAQLDLIQQWSVRWQLPISHTKCNLLYIGSRGANGTSFTMNDIPLTVTKFTADLGVLIDPSLKFDIHIRDIAMRAKQRAAIIHRCFVSRNTHNLVRAFKIYVRPLLEYASQIWNPFLTLIGTRFSPHVKNQGGGVKKTPQRKICNISRVWRPISMKFSQCLARWILHTMPLQYLS